MRLLSWNINGLRAWISREEKDLEVLLDSMQADVICFQESKLTRAELDASLAKPKGYDAFYSFSRKRSGYSGVVTYCKHARIQTIAAEEGLATENGVDQFSKQQLSQLDAEGRTIVTDHGSFVLINVYCPAVRDSSRFEFKMLFLKLLRSRVDALHQEGRRVIVVGDLNVSHQRIDSCDPDDARYGAFDQSPPRIWMNELVGDGNPLLDCFRVKNPTQKEAYTCWSTITNARVTNYGTRIDYILGSESLVNSYLIDCRIRPDIMGSDHCPVEADFHDTLLEYIENYKVASLCAKHLPEFSGTQKKLKAFFSPKQSQDATTASSSHEVIDLTVDLPKRQSQLTMREFMFQPASVAQSSSAETKASAPSPAVSASWKSILSGKPPAPPNCPVHGVPSVLRTVLKTGKNWGKKFYVCSLPEGKPDDINARCNFFAWANNNKKRQRDD